MTALRIFATGKPSLIGARVLPMSEEDEQFWRILAARRPGRLPHAPVHRSSFFARAGKVVGKMLGRG